MEQYSTKDKFFMQEHMNKLHQQLFKECATMTQYALTNGLQVDPAIGDTIANFEKQPTSPANTPPLGELIKAHNQLSTLIAPVKPNTLPTERQYCGKTGILARFPRLTITGHLIGLSLFFMLVFILLSLSPDINHENLGKDFTQLEGLLLLTYLILLLSIAGLGASFAALFQVNWLSRKHAFDPSQGSSYYVQILLGIVSGLFISQLIDVNSTDGSLKLLSKPTLALLGGFSSTVVYRILRQLLAALESLVKGDAEETIAAHRQLLQTEAQQMIQASRVKAATELLRLRSELPQEWQTNLDEQIEVLLGASTPNLAESTQPS